MVHVLFKYIFKVNIITVNVQEPISQSNKIKIIFGHQNCLNFNGFDDNNAKINLSYHVE